MEVAQTTYQQRKEASLCTRCGAPAAEDSSLCEQHRDDLRERRANWIATFRETRRAQGLCPYCPASRETPIGAEDAMCLACRIARRKTSTVEVVDNVVDKGRRIAARTRTHADGRTRYHGQGRRGQQPKAQLIGQDLRYARAGLDAAVAGYAMLETDEVKQLPRIQRDDIGHAADHQLLRVIGHCEDALERRGHFRQRHGRREE